MTEIRVPTLGESVSEATIGKWFKKPGDAVAVDEPLVELETDKVTIEVPAPAAGVLQAIAAKDGETVAVGALLGEIKEGAKGAAAAATTTGAPDKKQSTTAPIKAGATRSSRARRTSRGADTQAGWQLGRHAGRAVGAQDVGRVRYRGVHRAWHRQGRSRHQG